jgi:phage I-like protein
MSKPKTFAQVVLFEAGGTLRLRTRAVLSLAPGETSSWIQVAIIGSFKKGDRKFSITPAMLSEMVENFSSGKHPVPPTELVVDYEHLSGTATENPEAGKAAGWFKELELRDEGAELYARVDWTPPAIERLQAKEYKFISPEFSFNFTTPTMETIGCTLLAAAITNRPFLQGMAPITLTAVDLGDLTLVADLSYEQRRMFVERALRKRGTNTGCYCYVVATKDDRVVYEASATGGLQYFEETYAIGADGEVTLGGDPVEVVVNYEPLGAAALRRGEGDMKTIKLRVGDKDLEVPETAIEALDVVKQLRAELAARPAKSDHDKVLADNVTLAGRIDKLEAANVESKKQLDQRDAKDAVEKLVAGGKAIDGQRDSLESLFLSDRALFTKVTEGFPQRVDATEIGHGRKGPEAQTAIAEVMTEVAKLRAADPKLTEAAAQAQVFDKNAKLYERYVRETEQRVGKVA